MRVTCRFLAFPLHIFFVEEKGLFTYFKHSISLQFNHPQETTGRLEADFRHLISEVVPAGSNLMLVCAQVHTLMFYHEERRRL